MASFSIWIRWSISLYRCSISSRFSAPFLQINRFADRVRDKKQSTFVNMCTVTSASGIKRNRSWELSKSWDSNSVEFMMLPLWFWRQFTLPLSWAWIRWIYKPRAGWLVKIDSVQLDLWTLTFYRCIGYITEDKHLDLTWNQRKTRCWKISADRAVSGSTQGS